MFVTGLDDFAADVEHVAAGLPVPPVLIGHSMGAAVIERLLATRPVRAAALLSPVPPAGLLPMAARLAAEQPESLLQLSQFDPARLTTHVLEVLRPFYFSTDVAPEILAEATTHLCAESPRVLLDLSLRLHWQLPERHGVPLFVLGAEGDRIASADDVRATARHHGVEATLVPGLAHMLMLERQWEKPARALARWLATLENSDARGQARPPWRPWRQVNAGTEPALTLPFPSPTPRNKRCQGRLRGCRPLPLRRRRQEPLELGDRERPAHPIALEAMAVAGREEIELRLRFHALRRSP